MKYIPLTQEKFAIVDDEDYDWLMQWKWYALRDRKTYYARRAIFIKKGKTKIFRMHTEIMKKHGMDAKLCDHINHNGLDNRIINMRPVTPAENSYNRLKHKKYSSKYKGVGWCKGDEKWRARIQYFHKRISLGNFEDEIKAALAYDYKAKELFGDFAQTNF